jgi:hypothetical protein
MKVGAAVARSCHGGTISQMASSDDQPNGTDPSGRSEWERFEAFAKRLVAVPKAEVDALRKRDKRRRARVSS